MVTSLSSAVRRADTDVALADMFSTLQQGNTVDIESQLSLSSECYNEVQ